MAPAPLWRERCRARFPDPHALAAWVNQFLNCSHALCPDPTFSILFSCVFPVFLLKCSGFQFSSSFPMA